MRFFLAITASVVLLVTLASLRSSAPSSVAPPRNTATPVPVPTPVSASAPAPAPASPPAQALQEPMQGAAPTSASTIAKNPGKKTNPLLGEVLVELFRGPLAIPKADIESALTKAQRSPSSLIAASLLSSNTPTKIRYLRESIAKAPSRLAYVSLILLTPDDVSLREEFARFDPENLLNDIVAAEHQPKLQPRERIAILKQGLASRKLLLDRDRANTAVLALLQDIGYDEETAMIIAITTHHTHTISNQLDGIRLAYFDPQQGLAKSDLIDGLEAIAQVEALGAGVVSRVIETFAHLKKAEAAGDEKQAAFYRQRDRCLQKATAVINQGLRNLSYEEARRYAATYAKQGELEAFLSLDSVRYQLEDLNCAAALTW